jgi:hypothetical protein
MASSAQAAQAGAGSCAPHDSHYLQQAEPLLRLCAIAARKMSTMNIRIRFHINAALDAGATEEEIVATLYDFAPYFGAALARHAVLVALEEFARRTPLAVESDRGDERSVR